MPTRVEQEWVGPSGRSVRFEAFVPDRLDARGDLDIKGPAAAKVDAATAALARAGSRESWGSPLLLRLLLRAEGIASSEIERIRTSTDRLVLADFGESDEQTSWVLANITAIEQAAADRSDLSVERILAWHQSLMEGSRLAPRFVGVLRDVQNWIGGPRPDQAAYVPPPAAAVPSLMEDLVSYGNRTDLPAVVQAAVLHAQFETIHPFADGNGRVGRALVGWCLRRRGLAEGPLPPLSPIVIRDVGAYIAGLYDFREGSPLRWVGWFAVTCVAATEFVETVAVDAERVLATWQEKVADLRSDSSAVRVLGPLAERGAVDVRLIQSELGVSAVSARAAMSELQARGVVRRVTARGSGPGRPRLVWVAQEILDLLE